MSESDISDALTFHLVSSLAQRVGQHSQLHDHVAERVAQRPPQLVAELQRADVALLPDVKANAELCVCQERSSAPD